MQLVSQTVTPLTIHFLGWNVTSGAWSGIWKSNSIWNKHILGTLLIAMKFISFFFHCTKHGVYLGVICWESNLGGTQLMQKGGVVVNFFELHYLLAWILFLIRKLRIRSNVSFCEYFGVFLIFFLHRLHYVNISICFISLLQMIVISNRSVVITNPPNMKNVTSLSSLFPGSQQSHFSLQPCFQKFVV